MTRIFGYAYMLLLLFTFSCSKKESSPIVPPVSSIEAPIYGEVMLYDESTLEVEKNGMTVSVDSTSPPLKSVTGPDGKFFIPYIGFGKKALIFEKPGYGTFKLYGINHAYNNGTGTLITPIPSLGKLSTTTVTGLSAAVAANAVTISVITSPAANNNAPKYLRIFLSTRSAVSNSIFQKALETVVVKMSPSDKTLTKAELNTLGFTSGSTVYARVYGDSFWSNSYDDPIAGRTVFPNLNPATVTAVSFIVP